MMYSLALKSVRARLGRSAFVLLVVGFIVSFVSATFVLTDSLDAGFNTVVGKINSTTNDLVVRSASTNQTQRDPLPPTLVTKVSAIDGVASATGATSRRISILKTDGTLLGGGVAAVGEQAVPKSIGANFPAELPDGQSLQGAMPRGTDQIVIDAPAADAAGVTVGDTLTVSSNGGTNTVTLVGLINTGTALPGGAVQAWFDPAATAAALGTGGRFDAITVNVDPGASVADVQQRISAALPRGLEAVTGAAVNDQQRTDANDSIGSVMGYFQIGLLAFAGISAFVGAFIINNLVAVSIGQRLRELALLRAVGATRRQVALTVFAEASGIAVIASVLGLFGGALIGRGLISLLDSVAAGFPAASLVISARTVIVSLAVGVGVMLLASLIPAQRAGRVPPIAAMRPDLGYSALASGRRLGTGLVAAALGSVMFLAGLFAPFSSGAAMAVLVGGGAVLIFLGLNSLSITLAKPVSRVIGWPLARIFGEPAAIARDNSARSPRRTARTASALVIGVAIISCAGMAASSLSESVHRITGSMLKADFIVESNGSGGGPDGRMPNSIVTTLSKLPEVSSVSAEYAWQADVKGDGFNSGYKFTVIDAKTYADVMNLDVVEGSLKQLNDEGGVAVANNVAKRDGVHVGDQVEVVFPNGAVHTAPVSLIYTEFVFLGDWLMDYSSYSTFTTAPLQPNLVWLNTADGVSEAAANSAIASAISAYPQTEVQRNAEVRELPTDRINFLVRIINTLLSGAVLLSFVSIAVTLAMSVLERTREVGLLRAIGMTRRQLTGSIEVESVIVTVFGVVVGVSVGLAMGFAVVNALPSSLLTTIQFPVNTIGWIVVLAVVAALSSALYPALKAARLNVLKAINAI